ncbi:MAG: hypothetical protein IPK08_10120 [Bacteroidetes bacterium]|nr:hypothetical protein [Bacteroidota bacterium]
MGQCLGRYFINEFLEAEYVANISDFLGKQLDENFNNLNIKRKSSGDTPDFISAWSSKNIFLAEAKGRRMESDFNADYFLKWREQFDRISVKSGETEISLKGYIIDVCIANEENEIPNSKLFVEDPATGGIPFEEDSMLFNLIKNGHYKHILEKLDLGFIGESLIYKDNLNSDKIQLPVFTTSASYKEYIGIFSSRVSKLTPLYKYFFEPDFMVNLKNTSKFFYGIETNIFHQLMKIARGQQDAINNIQLKQSDKYFNESVIEFKDGTIYANPNLISIKNIQQF